MKEKNLKFEQALKELQSIYQYYKNLYIEHDDSIEKYKRGREFVKICETKLNDAEGKINELLGNNQVREMKDE
ncbi:MAG: exodeoxyribonuclease VII small subunit [Candidatus Muirbacterium halophilum]|nr:exodeoxyribonuclease VII small subunit [Candidatus Muirbacterium halophilum]